MNYTVQHIATIVRGSISGTADPAVITDLLIDSRKILFPESSLFFALPGPRRDGHHFIEEAYRKGIRNFVVSNIPQKLWGDSCFIIVTDVLAALQRLAAHHRNKFTVPVIGITGSNGKTIVKEWLNQLLGEGQRIVRSPKSFNSQIGVPLSVWQLHDETTLGIFEAGISLSGEMENLEKIIRPDIGIFTNIGDAHSEGFLNNRQKIREKLKLFTRVKTLIYCSDYHEIQEAVADLYQQLKNGSSEPFKILGWSRKSKAPLQITGTDRQQGRTVLHAVYQDKNITTTIPFADDASVENAIHCWCLLLHLGWTPESISGKMERLHPVAMRLELNNGINQTSIINDSYSADISSLKIALDFLSSQHQHPKRSVILADFLESGRSEKELYGEIARLLGEHRIQRLIAIGPVMYRNMGSFSGVAGLESTFYLSVEDFLQQFPHLHFGGETILIKGARVFALERIHRLLERQSHETVLEIDLHALVENLKAYQRLINPDTKMMAMVKAFSYGSGSYEIASVLQFNKVDYLAVAYADEGVELRKGGIRLPVMVMNPDHSSFASLVNYDLEPEIYSPGMLKAFGEYLAGEGLHHYPVHIELETGMNRLGFMREQLPELFEAFHTGLFKIQSVFSHLVASESPAMDAFTRQQAAVFEEITNAIRERTGYSFLRHLVNTTGISRHAGLQFDMVRIGIGLYGIDGSGPASLREVPTLKTSIAQIRRLRAGDTVSYGRSGVVDRDTKVATVRIGYADGYPRNLGNGKGGMVVHGKLCPTIGHICMDMTMIDIGPGDEVREGDEVIVFGKSLPVKRVAEWAGTIPYEILTGVSQRVKRVYYQE